AFGGRQGRVSISCLVGVPGNLECRIPGIQGSRSSGIGRAGSAALLAVLCERRAGDQRESERERNYSACHANLPCWGYAAKTTPMAEGSPNSHAIRQEQEGARWRAPGKLSKGDHQRRDGKAFSCGNGRACPEVGHQQGREIPPAFGTFDRCPK